MALVVSPLLPRFIFLLLVVSFFLSTLPFSHAFLSSITPSLSTTTLRLPLSTTKMSKEEAVSAGNTNNNNNKIYCLNVQLFLQPEERDNFLKIIHEDQEQSLRTESGCLQFVIGEDIEHPNIFYLHEEYTNEQEFQIHTQTEHYAKWQSYCKTLPWAENGTKTPIVDFYYGTHTTTSIPSSSSKTVFCLNVKLYPKDEVHDTFLQVIEANKKGSDETESLCLQYVYGQSTQDDDRTYFFHEQYDGKDDGMEGFEAHTKSPHFATWENFATTGEPFTKPPVVSKFKTI